MSNQSALLTAAVLTLAASPALAQPTNFGQEWVELLRDEGVVASFNRASAWKNAGGIVRTQIRLTPEEDELPQTVISVRVDCPGDRYGIDLQILFTRDNFPPGDVQRRNGNWNYPAEDSPERDWIRELCSRDLPSVAPPTR